VDEAASRDSGNPFVAGRAILVLVGRTLLGGRPEDGERDGKVALLNARRTAIAVVWIATAWFALALCWGIASPVSGGHASVVGSRAIIAENMLRWHMLSPVREYHLTAPTNGDIYADHPFGTYWLIALFVRVLGLHTYVVRLEPIAMSVATPALLYGIGRALWGPMQGALCALAYVVLPLALSFGSFPGFEVPLDFGMLLTTWGYLRYTQRWRTRWLLASLAGVLWTANVDWQGSVFLGASLGGLMVTQLLLPGWFGHLPGRCFGRWWALAASLACLTALAYGAYLVHIDAVQRLVAQKALRERGSDLPLLGVLQARSYWIDGAFTPIAVTAGKLALPVFLWRIIARKKTGEIFALAILLMASISYAHFKNGADAHYYWPLPFAPYWALSVGVLTETLLGWGHWIRRRQGWEAARARWEQATFAAVALTVLLILPDGIRAMPYGKATGGRFNDRGRRIFQDLDKSVALSWMTQRMEGAVRVQLHGSMHTNWANDWALHRPTVGNDGIPGRAARADDRYFIADMSFVSAADQHKLGSEFHLDVVGPYAMADRVGPDAPADGYVFDAREPTALEWYLAYGVDPVRTVRPAPWYTWELRDLFGQTPNPAPAGEPTTLDQIRIAHNVATEAGDQARADRYAKALVAQLAQVVATKFSDGTMLLGERYDPGVAPVLELYFQAAGPTVQEDQFDVESVVQARPLISLLGADDKVRTLGHPMFPSPREWKAGFIYASRTEIRKRPGREAYYGFFTAPDRARPPLPLDGMTRIPLITLR
jgi:4-amino-4-deoxy-L-arabinose transferase-like glycosyltransferase